MPRSVPFRYRLMALSTMLVMTVIAGSAVSFVDTRHPNALANEWASEARTSGSLPRTLAEFENLPPLYRKAAFKELAPEAASAVMKEHLGALLQLRAWTPQQRDVIERAIAAAEPALYASRGKTPPAPVMALCQAIGKAFSKDDARLFARIGFTDVPVERRYVSWVRKAKRYIGEPELSADASFGKCACVGNTFCADCGYFESCIFGRVPACDDTWFGCGCLGAFGCDGDCTWVPQ